VREWGGVEDRDDHGNGIPNPIGVHSHGNPKEWELIKQLGMRMGRNGNNHVWEWEWPLYHWNKFPSADAVFGLCNSNVQFII